MSSRILRSPSVADSAAPTPFTSSHLYQSWKDKILAKAREPRPPTSPRHCNVPNRPPSVTTRPLSSPRRSDNVGKMMLPHVTHEYRSHALSRHSLSAAVRPPSVLSRPTSATSRPSASLSRPTSATRLHSAVSPPPATRIHHAVSPPPLNLRPTSAASSSRPVSARAASASRPPSASRRSITSMNDNADLLNSSQMNTYPNHHTCTLFTSLEPFLRCCQFQEIVDELRSLGVVGAPTIRCCCDFHRILIARSLLLCKQGDEATRWYRSVGDQSLLCGGEVNSISTLMSFHKAPSLTLLRVLLDVFMEPNHTSRSVVPRMSALLQYFRSWLLLHGSILFIECDRLGDALDAVEKAHLCCPEYCEPLALLRVLRFAQLGNHAQRTIIRTICTDSAHCCKLLHDTIRWISQVESLLQNAHSALTERRKLFGSVPLIAASWSRSLDRAIKQRATVLEVDVLRQAGEHKQAASLLQHSESRKDCTQSGESFINAFIDSERYAEAFAFVMSNGSTLGSPAVVDVHKRNIVMKFAEGKSLQLPMLSIHSNLSPLTIRRWYRKSCTDWHPDKWRGKTTTTEELALVHYGFNMLTESYKAALLACGN